MLVDLQAVATLIHPQGGSRKEKLFMAGPFSLLDCVKCCPPPGLGNRGTEKGEGG